MKCVVFAYHDVGCTALKTLAEMDQDICAVFTHENDPKENRWFGSVWDDAKEMGLSVYSPTDVNTEKWVRKIKYLEPDVIFSFYYRQMISEEILAIPPKGAYNLHGSLLPKYRGRAPINWVLVKGETETGITLHHMVKKPDAGDIVAQKRVPITDEDTALSLFKKVIPLTRDILLENVPLIEAGTAPRIPQDHSIATYFGGRKPEDGRIDWTRPSRDIYNLVRAVTRPYPGAFITWNGQKILVWKAAQRPSEGPGVPPGTVVSLDPFAVGTGDGEIEIRVVQIEGQSEMKGAGWAKKNQLKVGINLLENKQ